jgi:exopolysaccharide biosynthesis operon protein EpsL
MTKRVRKAQTSVGGADLPADSSDSYAIRPRALAVASVAVGLLALSGNALALLDDRLELYVGETVTTDSNVFRLSKDQDPQATIGKSKKSDLLTTTAVGFNFNAPVSLQRFQAGLDLNRTHYNRFDDLDNTGHNGYATWLWQAGDQLSGQLGYTQVKRQSSFFDTDGFTGSNALTTKRLYGNAVYMLTPSWELQGGLAQETRRNSESQLEVNDVNVASADASFSYVSAAKNKLGLSLRHQDADFEEHGLVNGTLVNNNYLHRSVGIVTNWQVTGKSNLNMRVDRINRDFTWSGRKDYTGTTFRAAYDWLATAKLGVNALLQRDVQTANDVSTHFVLIEGVAISPRYEISDKLRLTGFVDYSRREYLREPIASIGNDNRLDHVRAVGLSLTYRPLRSLSFLLSGQHQKRSSNVPLADNDDRLISLNARFAF